MKGNARSSPDCAAVLASSRPGVSSDGGRAKWAARRFSLEVPVWGARSPRPPRPGPRGGTLHPMTQRETGPEFECESESKSGGVACRECRWRRWVALAVPIVALGLLAVVSGCMERLFYLPTREATPAPTWLSPGAEVVRFESSDGTRLTGWWVPAHGVDSRGAATVLHVHGNAGSMEGHVAFVDHLPGAGFNVFLFDYRGYGESEGTPRSRGPLVEDAKAALQTLRAREDIDTSRIALYGVSLGGAIAVLVAADDVASGGDLRALVLESPFASWRDVAASALGGDPPAFWARWLAALLIKDRTPGLTTPVEAIAGIDCPILILHGDADGIVPISHGRRLAAAAPRATLIEFPGGDHNTLQSTHPEARVRMIEFLRDALASIDRLRERAPASPVGGQSAAPTAAE